MPPFQKFYRNFPNQPLLILGKQCDYFGILLIILTFFLLFLSFQFESWVHIILTVIAGFLYGLAYFLLRLGSFLYFSFKLNYSHFLYNGLGNTIIQFLCFGLALSFVVSASYLVSSIDIHFFLLLAIFLFPLFIGNLIFLSQTVKNKIISFRGGNPFDLEVSKENILLFLRGEKTKDLAQSHNKKHLYNFDVLVIYYKDYRWLTQQLTNEEYNRKFRYEIANFLFPNDKTMVLQLIGI